MQYKYKYKYAMVPSKRNLIYSTHNTHKLYNILINTNDYFQVKKDIIQKFITYRKPRREIYFVAVLHLYAKVIDG